MRLFRNLKIPMPPPSKPGQINHELLDRFTLAHFGIGVGYALLGAPFWLALLLAILWELVENPFKVYASFLFPNATADTLRNSLGDTVAVCAGWLLMQQIHSYF